MTISYLVKREFKSNGKMYKKGSTWTPEGDEFDHLIVEQGRYVISDPKQVIRAEEKLQRQDRRKNGSKLEVLLSDAGYKTQKDIDNATDEELLSIKGVGKKSLIKLRG